MRDASIAEQTDDALVKSVLADELRQDINTDAAIKELISRGFVIRLFSTGLEITAPSGLKVKSKQLSSKQVFTSPSAQSASSSSDIDLNLQFSQTSGWLGGLKSSVGLKAVVGICIFLILIAGVGIYYSISAHQRQLKLDSIVEQAKSLSSKVGKSADEGMTALERVKQISTRSTKSDTEHALNAVASAQEIEKKSFNENQEFIDFIRQNEADLRETELSDLIDVAAIYGDSYYKSRSSLEEFLASLKLMLEFERDNLSAISRRKQPEESKYQKLYDNYMSSLEKQNNDFKSHLIFIDTIRKRNPKLESSLSEILSPYQKVLDSQR